MKRIIILILTIVFSTNSFAQLANESFEAVIFPPTTPGNWAVFDNGVSGTPNVNWSTNANANSGVKAAFMSRQFAMPSGSISEDYLATPAVNVPNNGQLKFFTRTLLAGIQSGTNYLIKVKLTSAGAQNDPNGYVLVQTWNDTNFLTNYQVYEEKTINLTAGTQVYIAFVLQQTATGVPIGNRWLIDDVKVVSNCVSPDSNLFNTSSITYNTATLNWATVPGAIGYQIENLNYLSQPTGIATSYSSTNSYPQTGLLGDSFYNFYVRSDCGGGNFSTWAGPIQYRTPNGPPVCGGNFYDSGTTSGDYRNNETGTPITICAQAGQQVKLNFTSFATADAADVLKIYNGNSTSSALMGSYSLNNSPGIVISNNGCLTFVFTSDSSGTASGWAASITCTGTPSATTPTTNQLYLTGNLLTSTVNGVPSSINLNTIDNIYNVDGFLISDRYVNTTNFNLFFGNNDHSTSINPGRFSLGKQSLLNVNSKNIVDPNLNHLGHLTIGTRDVQDKTSKPDNFLTQGVDNFSSWLQSSRTLDDEFINSNGEILPLKINPLGGNVGIGLGGANLPTAQFHN